MGKRRGAPRGSLSPFFERARARARARLRARERERAQVASARAGRAALPRRAAPAHRGLTENRGRVLTGAAASATAPSQFSRPTARAATLRLR